MSQLDIITQVRSKYPTPLADQHAAFLMDAAAATGLGLLKKSAGSHITLPSGVNVSQDILMNPQGQIWDILQDAENAANPTFNPGDPVDPSLYYAVPAAAGAGGSGSAPPSAPDQGATAGSFASFDQDVRASLGRVEGNEAAIQAMVQRVEEAVNAAIAKQSTVQAAPAVVAAAPAPAAQATVSTTVDGNRVDVAVHNTTEVLGAILQNLPAILGMFRR